MVLFKGAEKIKLFDGKRRSVDRIGVVEEKSRFASREFHLLMAASLILSAFLGIYLLATDRSIWILAPSHAYGLMIIVALDVILVILDFRNLKRSYVLTIILATITIILQLGDILTAPQYHLTGASFASYLFGLWTFDALLLAQSFIIITGIFVRRQLLELSIKTTGTSDRLVIPNSRRNFLVAAGAVAIVSIAGVTIGLDSKSLETILGSETLKQSSSTSTTESVGITPLTTFSIETTASQTQNQTNAPTQSTQSETSSYETQEDTVTSASAESEQIATTSSSSETASSSISSSSMSATGSIANVSQLQTLSPVYFEYPTGYPNVLFKKSDGTIIALSITCTHLCCTATFQTSSGEIDCPCHGSQFDDSGNVLRGPANLPLPQIELTIDSSGNIFPKSIIGSSPCLP